jgi:hypothetical protein
VELVEQNPWWLAYILAIPLQALFHAYIVMPAVGDGDDTHD